MKRRKILIKEQSQYLRDVLIVNSIVILSFALRFDFKVNIWQIYTNPAVYSFTYLTVFLTPLFIRLFYHHSNKFLVSVASLARSLSLNFTAIIMIIYILFPILKRPTFKYRSLIIITWLACMFILSIVNISRSRSHASSYLSYKSRGRRTSRTNSILNAFMPDTKDLKALLIGIFGSVIAFFVIYHVFGYK
jgi:FlaA1/EpsC-like NDP-sugar epimerase